ncbi:MAG: hypothetical protein FWC28_06315 [Proteobacteria bacterium]|nr:hypothetical protein [Pseudomonadota bacterium]
MKALELKADGKDPLEGATLGISFSTKFEISMPEVIGDTIESANNRNLHPELLLKSIRLTSQNDETYLFKKIEMVLTSPPGSFLPDAPIVDYEAPIVSWPANQLYIRANDINIIDYFVDGVCEAELNITTQHDILSFSVGFEVCMDGKVFWP